MKPADTDVTIVPKQQMKFRRRNIVRPSPDQMRRQNDVLESAWRHFGAPGPVIAFLNTRHDGLGGQPLHLAVESAEGLRRVEQVMAEMSCPPSGAGAVQQ